MLMTSRGIVAVGVLLLLETADAGQMCSSCIGIEAHESCTQITECANNEKCFMHNYIAEYSETVDVSEYYDYGCTSAQGCPSSLDYIIGKRDGHHIKCSACCNDTKVCNLQLTCDQLPNTGNALPRDCSDLHIPNTVSGIHTIYPFNVPHRPVPVYCEFDSQNRVWTVGIPEYLKGNDVINEITSHGAHALKIVMSDFNDTVKFADYDSFRIADEAHLYRMTVFGYNGTAGDSFSGVDGFNFSTIDRDHDTYAGSCAALYRGGWWYSKCHAANLNGLYLNGSHTSYADGIEWNMWHGQYYSLKTTTMMIRRL